MIMEDGIRTFMNFLKADKKKPCQIISAFLSRKVGRGSVDPTLLHLIKKVNKKVSPVSVCIRPFYFGKLITNVELSFFFSDLNFNLSSYTACTEEDKA